MIERGRKGIPIDGFFYKFKKKRGVDGMKILSLPLKFEIFK